MEEWKDIVGYEGIYQVSTMGQVRSLDRVVKNHSNTYYFKKGRDKASETKKQWIFDSRLVQGQPTENLPCPQAGC